MIGILGALIRPLGRIIEKAVPDKGLQEKLKAEITAQLLDQNSELLQAQASIIKAEAQGKGWLQKNWRPITIIAFLALLFAYWFGYPLDLGRETQDRMVDVIREVRPDFMLTHSEWDPYNTDHMKTMRFALDPRMIAQAWGHNPGEKVLGAPQLHLFEPHRTEQMGWKPDTLLGITPVWEKKRAVIECMRGQERLWAYYTNVAENRGNHFRRISGGQAGGRDCRHVEGFQSVFPRTVDQP